MKTVLAPNAPWYTKEQLAVPLEPSEPKRKLVERRHRAKPADIDKRFELWLNSLEKVK